MNGKPSALRVFLTAAPAIVIIGIMIVHHRQAAPARPREYGDAQEHMGTLVTVKFHAAAMGEDEAQAAQQAAFAEIATVDRLMSNWTDDSEISLVNREAFDHPVPVSEMTFEVLEQALQIWIASGGAFDLFRQIDGFCDFHLEQPYVKYPQSQTECDCFSCSYFLEERRFLFLLLF